MKEMKELKIERKVFDRRTMLAIYKLLDRGVIKTVESAIKEGKESVVFSAKDKTGKWLALKVYRTKYCDFKTMRKYLIVDPRFARIKRNRRFVVNNWCKREFGNLKTARDHAVSCPEPIAFRENVLVMSFIGEHGLPSPRLVDVRLKGMQKIYDFVLEQMKKLAKAKLIHSDLSAYNILIFDKPYLIDFSQAITDRHPLAKEFLAKDIKNINSYFKKFGVKIKQEEKLLKQLLSIMGTT